MQKLYFFLGLVLSLSNSKAQLFINEVCNNNDTVIYDEDGDSPDYIELYYPGIDSIDLSQYYLSDNLNKLNKFQLPAVYLQTGEHFLIFASGKNKRENINHYETAIKENDTWKYLVPTSEPPASWTDPGFAATGWSNGTGGFGYADGDDATTITPTNSVYFFKSFTITDTADLANAILHMDYDDGFVAYLNGIEIARNNLGVPGVRPAFSDNAPNNHEALMYAGGDPEVFVIDPDVLKSTIQNGTNVLAIQVHNQAITSSDLSARAWLSFGIKSANTYFGPLPSFFTISPGSIAHTNFKIGNEGETIFLTLNGSSLVDSITCPALTMNTCYARSASGGTLWCITNNPTPGDFNSAPVCYDSFVADPIFNLNAGYYTSTQSLTLSLAPGASGTIYYSTDGDDPDITENLYTGPIIISSTSVIRARVFPISSSQLPSNIITRTFFINEDYDLPVFSIVSDSFNLWDANYGIHVLGPGADSANYPYFGSNFWQNWERPMHVEYFHKDKQLKFNLNGGIKIHGGWSRGNEQKSLRLLAKSKYDAGKMNYPLITDKPFIHSYSAINLRNGGNDHWDARSRDAFMQRLASTTHVDYMGYEPAYAYLNGNFWGHFEIRERQDEDYIAGNHGIDPENVDIISHTYNGLNAIGGNLDDFTELYATITNTTTTTTPEFYSTIDSLIDLFNFTDYIATETYLGNGDWASYPNNTKFWHQKSPYGKWRWALWDVDFGLGYGGSPTDNYLPTYLSSGQYTSDILSKMLENPTYENFFINRYADLINTVFQPTNFNATKSRTQDSLVIAIQLQQALWGGWGLAGLISTYNNMTTHNNQRINYQRDNLVSDFGLNGKVNVTLNVSPAGAGYIKISTIIPENLPWSGIYFDGNPVTITAHANPGYTFSHWNPNSQIPLTTTPSIHLNIDASDNFTAVFTGAPDSNQVVMSEVNYNSDNGFNCGDWFEIWNPGNSPIDLTGYYFERTTYYQRIYLRDNKILSPNERLVFVQDTTKFNAAYPGFDTSKLIYHELFTLDGSSDSIMLYNQFGDMVFKFMYVDSLPWKRAADGSGRTMELKESEPEHFLLPSAWITSCMYGTPGGPHVPCGEPLVISEINYNPLSNTGEWIELYNNSDSPIDLSGYIVKDDNNDNTYVLPSGLILGSGNYYVVAKDTALFNEIHYPIENVIGNYTYSFSNNNELIRVYDSSETIVYSLLYDDNNGWPMEADGQGKTLEPYGFTGDVNDGSNWFAGCRLGSPGWPYRPECYWGEEDECLDQTIFYFNSSTRQLEVTFPYLDCSGLSFFIIDTKGSSVTQTFAVGFTTAVNLNTLSPGVYFVKISNPETGQQTQKKWPLVITP